YLPVGIVFKGSGFYATDNRSPSGTESRHSEDNKSESSQVGESENKTKQEDKAEVKEN
ncbi:MAG: FmdB family transcriptional regulator, partial [Bacteroidetes bacterium]